jgi:hypothetical protein
MTPGSLTAKAFTIAYYSLFWRSCRT